MIAITVVTYPHKAIKEVIQLFNSPALPARLESAKELAAMTYSDEGGQHACFVIEIPDSDVGAYVVSQGKRTAYFGSRIAGYTSTVHIGQKISEAITTVMPLLP
ncbi:MAG: hypothetical protein NDJ19_08615 [Ramlibacter sp.]|nr:hypothetical protein [Ramlibacter sp.]